MVEILLLQLAARSRTAPAPLANSFTLFGSAKKSVGAGDFAAADNFLHNAVVNLHDGIAAYLYELPPSHLMCPGAATRPTWTIVAGAIYVAAALATWGVRPVHADIAREIHKTIGAFLEKRETYAMANRGQLAASFGAQVEFLADALILLDAAQLAEELRQQEAARDILNDTFRVLLEKLRR